MEQLLPSLSSSTDANLGLPINVSVIGAGRLQLTVFMIQDLIFYVDMMRDLSLSELRKIYDWDISNQIVMYYILHIYFYVMYIYI